MADYQKLYAYLVGQIDDVLQLVCYDLLNGRHNREELEQVGKKLLDALHAAEEMYLDESEEG